MTNKAKHFSGLFLAMLGMVLLLLNAADYVMGWNRISSAISAIGLMLAVVGAGLVRNASRRKEQV